MNELIINGNTIQVKVDENKSWSLKPVNANFMLSRYSGVGSGSVNIITFSNIEDTVGKVELYVNGIICNNYEIKDVNNVETSYFLVYPTSIIFMSKADKQGNTYKEYVTVETNENWSFDIIDGGFFSARKSGNNMIELESIIDSDYSNKKMIVYSTESDAYEYITVKNLSLNNNDNSVFNVYPTLLEFTKQNESKEITVTTNCSNGFTFTKSNNFNIEVEKTNPRTLKVTYTGNTNNSITEKITINSCGKLKEVTLKYEQKSSETDSYLYIINVNGNDITPSTSTTFNFDENTYNKLIPFTLSSSSINLIESLPSNIKGNINGDVFTAELTEYDIFDNGIVTIKNRDNLKATINFSMNDDSFVPKSGVSFYFDGVDGDRYEIDYSKTRKVTICSYYNKDGKPLNYNVHSNDFKLLNGTEISYKPYKPNQKCTELTLERLTETSNDVKVIQFEEVDTFNRLYLEVKVESINIEYKFFFVDDDDNLSKEFNITSDAESDHYDKMYKDILSEKYNNGLLISEPKYTLKTDADWITIQGTGFAVAENSEPNPRTGVITYTQDESGEELVLYVNQEGNSFVPYYELCIRTAATFTTCNTSETVSHNTSSDIYNITIRSRYYTSDTDYEMIPFTLSTNESWIHINGISYTVDINETTSPRNGTITYKQDTSNKEVYLYIKQNAKEVIVNEYVFEDKTPEDNLTLGSVAGGTSFLVTSLKNGENFTDIDFSSECGWVEFYSAFTSDNTVVIAYNYDQNYSELDRTCNVSLTQGESNKILEYTLTQEGKEPIVPECTVIIYEKNYDGNTTVYYKTENGTQQAYHSVSGNERQELCHVADGTELFITTNDDEVTVTPISFYYSGGRDQIVKLYKEVKIPKITGLLIQNNEPGTARIKVTINNTITSNIILDTKNEQTYSDTYSGNTTIDIIYSANTWSNNTSFVYIEIQGEYLEYSFNYENQITISEFDEGFRVTASSQTNSSCSGSIITKNGDYTVIINIIFEDYPYTPYNLENLEEEE